MRHRCAGTDCAWCEELAEEQAAERTRPTEGANDWRTGTDRYERELDDRWGT